MTEKAKPYTLEEWDREETQADGSPLPRGYGSQHPASRYDDVDPRLRATVEDRDMWRDAFLATQDCRESEEETAGDAVRRVIRERDEARAADMSGSAELAVQLTRVTAERDRIRVAYSRDVGALKVEVNGLGTKLSELMFEQARLQERDSEMAMQSRRDANRADANAAECGRLNAELKGLRLHGPVSLDVVTTPVVATTKRFGGLVSAKAEALTRPACSVCNDTGGKDRHTPCRGCGELG